MNLENALNWSRTLLSLSFTVQSLEMLVIAKRIEAKSPWDWAYVKSDFAQWPRVFRALLDSFYVQNYLKIVYLQLLLALALVVHPHWMISTGLIVTCFLIVLRFRGVFNGGSDYMTLANTLGLTMALAHTQDEFSKYLGLYFIAVQTTLSYFVAGVIKLKNRDWRSGLALEVFLSHSNYTVPEKIKTWVRKRWVSLSGSWLIILWECLFPLVWIKPSLTLTFLLLGLGFHLSNFISFGLNRFFFAWMASYPAIIFCSNLTRAS